MIGRRRTTDSAAAPPMGPGGPVGPAGPSDRAEPLGPALDGVGAEPAAAQPGSVTAGPAVPGPADRVRPDPSAPARPEPSAPAKPHPHAGRTRFGTAWTAFVVAGLLLVFLLIFILQNGQHVSISYLGAHGSLPLGVALLLAAVCGLLLVAIPGSVRILQLRRLARRHAAARRDLEAQH